MKLFIRIAAILILGGGTAYAAPHLPFVDAGANNGCAVGHHSHPVGNHSKPCPQPHGCAIGRGGPVGNHSKPCPRPHGCAIGNPRFVGDRSKPCPTPHGHHHQHSPSHHGHGAAGTVPNRPSHHNKGNQPTGAPSLTPPSEHPADPPTVAPTHGAPAGATGPTSHGHQHKGSSSHGHHN